MNKIPVTSCILVKNEADRLVRTLPPLEIFEEVLVFDSGSKDDSIELCVKAGARVESVLWEGFGKTRRKLFESASQPWIFWIDADELITEELSAELCHMFANKEPEKTGFSVNRIVQFQGQWIRHGEWFPDWTLRLFRSDSWGMKDVAVHESVELRDANIGHLDGLLEHHSYRSWEDFHARSLRYSGLWAEQQASHGRTVRPMEGKLRAIWKFLRALVIRRGFLDGGLGWQIAWTNAKEVHLKYSLLREMNLLTHKMKGS